MKAKGRYEKQGIGEQGGGETEEEERKMRGESFFKADNKETTKNRAMRKV